MKITRELLWEHSNKGAFTKKQIEALGLTWPPQQGWIWTILGKEITEEQFKILSKQSEQSNQLGLWDQ
jgi:hypothetical protein